MRRSDMGQQATGVPWCEVTEGTSNMGDMRAVAAGSKRVILATMMATLVVSVSSGAPPPAILHLSTGARLNVPLYGQQTNVWCWDASSLMVIKYYRPFSTLKQCDLANQATNVNNCCNNPFPTICIHTGWEMLSNNGFGFSDSGSALSWNDLRAQINAKTPVLYAWGWNGGGGHMMVAVGYYTLFRQRYVQINNPWPPSSGSSSGGAQESYTYAAWVGGSGYDHIFWHDWYNVVDKIRIRTPHPLPYFPQAPMVLIGPGPVERIVQVPNAVMNEAERTLDALRKAPRDVQALDGLGEGLAKNARLGSPIREYIVGLDSLRSFKRGMDAKRIVRGGNEFFFSIVVSGRAQSSVRVIATSQERAQTESIGNVALARQLESVLGKRASEFSRTPLNAVRIPALGLYFVSRMEGSRLQLASLYDVPVYQLRKGAYLNADAVFGNLGAIARKEKAAM